MPTVAERAAPAPVDPPPQPSRRPAGRTRTRILGFDRGTDAVADPVAKAKEADEEENQGFATGWVAIVKGPGTGQHFPIFTGVAMVGRGEDQAIRLDFGDNAISRQNHAAIAYDPEDNKFYLGHGGKSNIIKLNGKPVLSTEPMSHGDVIRIGETTLRFVALCDETFSWADTNNA